MKADIHPKYHPAVFIDGDNEVITKSTRVSEENRVIDGVEDNVLRVEISGFSHPFWTGRQKVMDAAGRIERFKKKYEKT